VAVVGHARSQSRLQYRKERMKRIAMVVTALAAAMSAATAVAYAHSIPKRENRPVAQANGVSTFEASKWLRLHGTNVVPVVGGNGDPDNPANYIDGECRGLGKASYGRWPVNGVFRRVKTFADFDCVVPLAKWIDIDDPANPLGYGHADYNDVVTYKLRLHALPLGHWLVTNVAKVS
jgi:hypothetical protein